MGGPTPKPLADRIENSIERITETGCWIWMRHCHHTGYGVISKGRESPFNLAHRVSYEVFVGPIPDGLDVCHHCDVRSCVSPHHFFLGTAEDNGKDAAKKGRIAHGMRSGSRRIDEDTVREIRAATGSYPQIARRFGVSTTLAWNIKKRRVWARLL